MSTNEELGSRQIQCLRNIAAGMSPVSPPCATGLLEELVQAGLIEHVPRVWLPVQPVRKAYRLTARGAMALRRLGN